MSIERPLSTALSFTQRQQILFSDLLKPQELDDTQDISMQVEFGRDSEDDWEDEERAGLLTLPPGEEGFLQSHAGGEAVLHDILNGMTNSCVFRSISPALPC